MARILNLIIVILELIAFAKTRKSRKLKDCMIYYTQISNMLTLASSLLLVILGQRYFVEVFRYLSVSMLIMTFFVTAGILVPMTGRIKQLLFSGSGLYHHLIIVCGGQGVSCLDLASGGGNTCLRADNAGSQCGRKG